MPAGSVLPVPGTARVLGAMSSHQHKSKPFPRGARLSVCAIVGKAAAGRRGSGWALWHEAGAVRAGAWARARPATCAGRSGQGAGARKGWQPAGAAAGLLQEAGTTL